jgi:hypothetical protein
MTPAEKYELREQFLPVSDEEREDIAAAARAGDTVLHSFLTEILEKQPVDYEHMKTKDLEKLLQEEQQLKDPDIDKCLKLQKIIRERVESPIE